MKPQRASKPLAEKPRQYIKGFEEFYKLKFWVTSNVLIPRPETELLVDGALKFNPVSVLDVGTGSGNIAIAIAKNLPSVKIVATDISSKALVVAKQNANLHGVLNKIQFIESDLLKNVKKQDFDFIVTNLPYIPNYRIPYLDSSVKDFEPHVALDGGDDGFDLYRRLFKQMQQKKIIPKLLIGEIDYTQGEIAISEMRRYFPNCKPKVNLDLTHKQRILIVKF